MRTTLAESLHYIIFKVLEMPTLRDGQVDNQLSEFLPMLLLFIAKNLDQDKKRPSDVEIVDPVLHHKHSSVPIYSDRTSHCHSRQGR
jgi:hypothetical protein